MSKKTALITGIRGQDGQYLASLLLKKGYSVHGTSHQWAGDFFPLGESKSIRVTQLDLSSNAQIDALIEHLAPSEIYNFAARSSSAQLFDDAVATADINGVAVTRILEAVRKHSPGTKIFQALSSEVYAGGSTSPQDETTLYSPLNAYGAAKAYAGNIVKAYRESFNLFAVSGILYNHESPLRGAQYVTQRVASAVADIANGRKHKLELHSLSARRDWGYAEEYVEAAWRTLQHGVPMDYVIATGRSRTVSELCEIAFSCVGLDYREYVSEAPDAQRREERIPIVGNPARAYDILGWRASMSLNELMRLMVGSAMRVRE